MLLRVEATAMFTIDDGLLVLQGTRGICTGLGSDPDTVSVVWDWAIDHSTVAGPGTSHHWHGDAPATAVKAVGPTAAPSRARVMECCGGKG